MRTKEEIFKDVISILESNYGVDKPETITLESHLKNDLDFDSLEIVDLYMAMERYYNLDLKDYEYDSPDTMADFVDTLYNCLEKNDQKVSPAISEDAIQKAIDDVTKEIKIFAASPRKNLTLHISKKEGDETITVKRI